jgi:pyrroline-5-carboxylate reductase
MNQDIEFAFIGCGNMGGAILDGILGGKTLAPEKILVVERSEEQLARWARRGVRCTERLEEARRVPRILLAVKPQMFSAVAEELGPLPTSSLVISVMAGLSSDSIQGALGANARVIRTMPNTPCQIHAGITAIAPGLGSSAEDVQETERIMATVGEVVHVEESEMYAVTAISGSGPAYVFLLAEAWIDAAMEHGIEKATAERLVKATLQGAARLAGGDQDPAALRAAVTSKGGTTAAAIARLEERGFRAAMNEAISAATQRGRELDSEISS